MDDSVKILIADLQKRLHELEEYVHNLDDFLPARSLIEKAIGYIEKKESVSEEELTKRFRIPAVRARKLIELFLDYGFVEEKEDVYRIIPEAFHKYPPQQLVPVDQAEKFTSAIRIIAQFSTVSSSLLQRKLGIGYEHANAIMKELESKGYVTSPNEEGKRMVLKKE